ncbi:MAG TPA: hypothetical protein VIM52_05830 [Stellaceae bacterium]
MPASIVAKPVSGGSTGSTSPTAIATWSTFKARIAGMWSSQFIAFGAGPRDIRAGLDPGFSPWVQNMKTKADIQCEGIQAGLTNQQIIKNVLDVYPDARSGNNTVAFYRVKLRYDPKFIAKYGKRTQAPQREMTPEEMAEAVRAAGYHVVEPPERSQTTQGAQDGGNNATEPEPDAVGATVMPKTPGGHAPPTYLRKVDYQSLNGKQKEMFNFHKLAGILGDYGFSCIKLSDDWLGGDFLACHINGFDIMKVQLKSRLTIDRKYSGKNVFIAFPANHHWYLVEHDILVQKVTQNSPSWLNTESWIDVGCYHSANPGTALLQSLSGHRLNAGSLEPQPEDEPEDEEERPPEEPKRWKWFRRQQA